MSHHNARVLSLTTESEIVREIRRAHPEDAGVRHMLPKARHYLVRLDQIRRPIAHILKEAFLSQGGDAVVSRDLITAAVDHSDVILCGTSKQFAGACANLREQGFGCGKLASEIEASIQRFHSVPEAPDPASVRDPRLAEFYQAIGKRTLIMGILNVTPDSFSDGGAFLSPDAAIAAAMDMAENGADVIDIGGESTRPGADSITEEEEISRVVPVVKQLAGALSIPISVDTTKASVARSALDAGALIVNDISACTFDTEMAPFIARSRCPAVLMHIKGQPRNMQDQPVYDDLMGEIQSWLSERIRALADAGVDERLLLVDPGIGFGKTADHNLEILRRLRELKSLGRPILVGTSRKSTIGKVLGDLPPQERLEGTAATVAIAIANGADIVRVHDVKEMARVAKVADAVARAGSEPD